MILVDLNPIKWRFTNGDLPSLLNVSWRDGGHNQDARPDDSHPLAPTLRESVTCGVNHQAPPTFALAIREVAQEQAGER